MHIRAMIGTILRGGSGSSVEGALLGAAGVFFGITALQAHGANEECVGAWDHTACGIHAINQPQATDEPALFPDGRTVVEFTSDYCPSCRKMEPVLADVIRRCGSSGVSLVRIDVESPSGSELAVHWRISDTPTIVLLDPKHAEAQRLIGLRPAAELRRAVEGALRVECSRG